MENGIYKLPILTSYLIKDIIFSMENQETIGFLDLVSAEVVEVINIEESIVVKESKDSKTLISISVAEDEDRFLELPSWGSIEGFKIREMFIKDVKNPVYRKKLDRVFYTGRGVFRKFKEVLRENPIIERQWFEFQSNYMRAIVVNWYKECKGYVDLFELKKEELEELPNDLLISDFTFSMNVSDKDIKRINNLKTEYTSKLDYLDKILINRRQDLLTNPLYIAAYNVDNEVVGYIEWEIIDSSCIEVTSYCVIESYQGLGIFSLLFDKLMRQAKREKFVKLVIFSTELFKDLHRTNTIFEFSCNFSYSVVDIMLWNQEKDSSELMDV